MEKAILITSRWFSSDTGGEGIACNKKLQYVKYPIYDNDHYDFISKELFKKESFAGIAWKKYITQPENFTLQEFIALVATDSLITYNNIDELETEIFAGSDLAVDAVIDDIKIVLEKLVSIVTNDFNKYSDKDYILNIHRINDTNIFIAHNWFDKEYNLGDKSDLQNLAYLNAVIATIEVILKEENKDEIEFTFLFHDADLFECEKDNYCLNDNDKKEILTKIDKHVYRNMDIKYDSIQKYLKQSGKNIYVFQHTDVSNGYFTHIIRKPDIVKIKIEKEEYVIDILQKVSDNIDVFQVLLTDRFKSNNLAGCKKINEYNLDFNLPIY